MRTKKHLLITKLSSLLSLINLKHALFSLFFLASVTLFILSDVKGLLATRTICVLTIGSIAFFFARSLGIVCNQVIDRFIDAKNPRTSKRILPQKQLSVNFAKLCSWLSGGIFLLLCAWLNVNSVILGAISIAVMLVYPYTKRFTYLSHWILGGVYYLASLLVFCSLSPETFSQYFLVASLWGCMGGFIIAANDIIYALQDMDFDRKAHLYSIPKFLGKEKSIFVAAISLLIGFIAYLGIGCYITASKVFYLLSVIPGCAILYTLNQYRKLLHDRRMDYHNCFFIGNIFLVSSFFLSMVLFFLHNIVHA